MAVTALLMSPVAAVAEDRLASTRTFGGGDMPLEMVRPQPATDSRAAAFHAVLPGEHLSAIAAAHGLDPVDGWRRLFDANPQIRDPDQLEPGHLVRIPAATERFERRELPRRVVAVRPRPAGGGGRTASGAVWDRLARCESGGNWHINTGNGYYGGLQFSLRSWQAVGGTGYPHEHSRETQIAMAQRLLGVQGWGAWPACSRRLGLR